MMGARVTKETPVLVASALILSPDDKVLLALRPPDKPLGNLWETPGGKVEPGESPRAALHRELLEELGVRCTVSDCVSTQLLEPPVVSRRFLLLHFLAIIHDEPKPLASVELGWFDMVEAFALDLMPSEEKALCALLTRRNQYSAGVIPRAQRNVGT
jgi:8-oxo-dGTP diphosphatase